MIVPEHLANTPHVGSDYGFSVGHGLEHDQGQAFRVRGESKDVNRRVKPRDIVFEAGENEVRFRAGFAQ